MGRENEIEDFEKIEKDLEKGGVGLLFLCFFGAVERSNLSGRGGEGLCAVYGTCKGVFIL